MQQAAALLALLAAVIPARAQDAAPGAGGDRPFATRFATRSPVIARNGMAATSHPLASQIAVDVLQAGGSAVDAAIAANAALGLMEPVGNGLGGDLFALVWDPKTERLWGLNGSGRSARGLDLAGLRERLGEGQRIPAYGPLSVTVPGCADGWGALHARFGRLPFEQVLAPAIRYAREGFPVTQVIAGYWAANLRAFERARELEGLREPIAAVYTLEGRAPREGDVFRNPDLARTLEALAEHGARAFYEGELADRMDAYFRRVDCPLRKEDLAAHRSEWVEPISTTYRGVALCELPPNGQGLAALQMLNILEGYDLAALGHNSAEYLHVQVEAKKLAFADRARFYADPRFYDAPLERLLSKEYAAARRALIDPEKAARSVEAGPPPQGDTIYLCTADASGMMVSLIQSNYRGMGSGLVPDGLGFMLQDRGELFTLEEGHPNVYAPAKRPFHTIIPAFALKDGKPWIAFGVMGGAMQPQGHVQILCNLLDFGMNLQEAGDAPRYNHEGSSEPTGQEMTDGGVLCLESGIGEAVRKVLAERGHRIQTRGSYGGYQAILWDAERGVYFGASEMRKDGQVSGF
jgi:gamma-glutamyltranspeptidase/glutathione hydrolase